MNKFWYYFRHAVVHPEKTCRQGGQRDRRCLRIDGAELTTIDATLDQAGQEGSIVVEIHFEELVHLLVAPGDRIELERNRHQPAHPPHRFGQLAGQGYELLSNRLLALRFHEPLQPPEFLCKEVLQERSDDGILAFVIEIQRPFRETCLLGNISMRLC